MDKLIDELKNMLVKAIKGFVVIQHEKELVIELILDPPFSMIQIE